MKFKLPKNIDTLGRLIRLGLGLCLLAYAYWNGSIIALILAIFTFFESAMSWCLFYHILGRTSCPTKKRP